MNLLKCIIFIFGFLSFEVFASAQKTPANTAFGGIRALVEIYKENYNGSTPNSWEEFIGSGVLSGQVLENARQFCDIENRYFFPKIENPFQITNRQERIIIMAKRSGGEGNRPDSLDPQQVEGRWLIVETEDGEIQTRRYSETALRAILARGGLNLDDYTFDAPPAPKILSPGNPNSTSGLVLGGPEDSTRSTPPRQEKSRDLAKEWWIWSIALGAASLFGIFLYKKQHSIE